MARQLTSIPYTIAPDAEYPAGRMRNNDPPTVGTPVIEELYGDIIQFFHKLMRLAGVTYNDLPENETQNYQFIEALVAYVRTITASTTQKGVAELATSAETQAGGDNQRVVTPAGLESKTATETRKGIAELATLVETKTGIDSTRIVTVVNMLKTLKPKYFIASANNSTYQFDTQPFAEGNGFCIVTGTGITVRMPSVSDYDTYSRAPTVRLLNQSTGGFTIKTSSGATQYPTTIPSNYYVIYEFNGSEWICCYYGIRPIG